MGVKTGIDFVLDPGADGTRLTTDTRVIATDPHTRACFRVYWLLILPDPARSAVICYAP